MLPFHLWLHHLCVVEAKHAMSIIDEHVEMPQKVTAENSANARIGCLEMLKVLNDNQRVCYSVRASFEYVQVGERGTHAETDADEPCSALNPQVKLSGQRRINGCDLGACIHQKVVRPVWLIATGTMIWERWTSRKRRIATFPGQCGSA